MGNAFLDPYTLPCALTEDLSQLLNACPDVKLKTSSAHRGVADKLSNTDRTNLEICHMPCRHAPIYLWYTLTRKGYHGMRKDVEKCLRNAHILKVQHYTTSFLKSAALAISVVTRSSKSGNLTLAFLRFQGLAGDISLTLVKAFKIFARRFCLAGYAAASRPASDAE